MHRVHLRAWLLAFAAVVALFASGCDDPSCALSGDCRDVSDADGLGGVNPATTPVDHQWLSPAAPSVEEFFPSGTSIAKTTPIAIQFSESMAASTLTQAFEIALVSGGSGQGLPVVVALVADGRLAVLIPTLELTADTEYVVRYRQDAVVTDLQGTAIVQPENREVGTFKTAATDPSTPRIVTSFPRDNATGQSATGEYVVLFDRPLNPTSVNLVSWVVRVGGVAPANNPAPTVLSVNLGQGSAPETRVWRWRSTDAAGLAVPFAVNADVTLTLSPNAAPITAASGGAALAQTVLDFKVAAFGAPVALDLVSLPSDAIGLDNLDGDISNPLAIAVDLVGATSTDLLGMFLIGTSRDLQNPRTIALFREVQLGDVPTFDALLQLVEVGESELDLASGTSTPVPRFKEGDVAIGFTLRRGTTRSPVVMLDIDAIDAGAQPVFVDTTPPVFSGFGSSGVNTSSFASDMVGLSVVGRANEQIRVATVEFDGATNNGVEPPVVATTTNGLFVAAPVALDVLAPLEQNRTFELVVFDRALNASVATTVSTYRQVGTVVPDPSIPIGSQTIQVEVVDARTLAPIAGARVFSHEDNGTGLDIVDLEVTNANGLVAIELGLGSSMITVDAANYDLFSLTEVGLSRVSVPLQRTGAAPALLAGAVTNSSSFTTFDRFVSDSRRFEAGEPTSQLTACSTVGSTSVCQFGPLPVRAGPIGALSFFGIEPAASAFGFSAAGFLRSFALQIPIAGANPGVPITSNLSTTLLLSDASTPQEERALPGPAFDLDIAGVFGPSFGQTSGEPRITLEALSPGFPGSLVAGLGTALDPVGTPASAWAVRSAFPGAVDPTDGKYPGDEIGLLVTDGTLEGGLYLRCEVRDSVGARTGVRLPSDVVPGTLALTPPPRITAPTFGASSGGLAYSVAFTDVLPDGGDPGIHRVTLTATSGRRWTLWQVDTVVPAPPADPFVRIPDLAADGGVALPNGAIGVEVDSYAYPTFDPTRFAFSELERRSEVIAHSPLSSFLQP